MLRNTFKRHTIYLHEYAFLTKHSHVPARAMRNYNYLLDLVLALPRDDRFYVWKHRPLTWKTLFLDSKGRRLGGRCEELSRIEISFINLVSRISYFKLPWTVCVTLNSIDRARQLAGGEDIDLGLMTQICHRYKIPFKVLP